jgi:hypothetical protein
MRITCGYLTTQHDEEFFHMLDVTHLLSVSFGFCGFCIELILRQEGIHKLPIRTVTDIHVPDGADFLQIVERVVKFFFGSDIIEICILNDFFKACFWFGKKNGCHDDAFYLLNTLFNMSVFFEPFAGNLCSDVFVFLVLHSKSSIMEEAGNL